MLTQCNGRSEMSRYLAEFIGTFVLVFAGCGAAVLSGGQAGALGVAVAFGLALLAMVYTIGHISGCHINPAVTLGLFISKKMPRKDAPGYWIAQIAGGIVAAGVLLVIAHGMPGGYNPAAQGLAANGYAAHSPGHYTLGAAALTEFVFTFILVITVIGATDLDAPVGFAGIPIGLALLLANLVAIPVTNASINPAQHWTSDIHGRLGHPSALAFYRCAIAWRGGCLRRLPPDRSSPAARPGGDTRTSRRQSRASAGNTRAARKTAPNGLMGRPCAALRSIACHRDNS